ncbi:MAG TPA: tetratricopeptide repeat protein [Cyclobacteriaceae bacterium]|nr:tetratricopeptide repeat protein [Cyclobacteriaceae bacterium]
MEQRRLAAILFSDISGYTAQMGEDENKALHLLEKNRKLHRALVKLFHGTIIDEIGDGTFACFNSALDAVYCAVELTRTCVRENFPGLHIGIHLAEVIFSGHKVFGDGVNLASRIQTSAGRGEILISEDVYRNIRNHEGISAEFLGEKNFKNIKEPVGIYKLTVADSLIIAKGIDEQLAEVFETSSGNISISAKKLALYITAAILLVSGMIFMALKINYRRPPQLVEKSIAVLPFKNYSPGSGEDYFSDGMTEEVINYLSKIRDLKVISRTSVEQYKDSPEDIKTIARELGVSNILEGSVRKDSNKIRVTVQLIQAQSGFHLWSDEYDRNLSGIFEVQTDIAKEVAGVLAAVLSEKEKMLIQKRTTVSLTAYDFYMKAKDEFMHYRMGEGNVYLDRAVSLYLKALALDPRFAPAYAGLGWTYYRKTGLNEYFSENYLDSVKIMGEKALGFDDNCEEAHALLGHYYYELGDPDRAFAEIEKAIDINPNYIEALWLKADMLFYNKGDYVDGINFSLKTMELYHGPDYGDLLAFIGGAYMQIGLTDRAENYFRQAVSLSGDSSGFYNIRYLKARSERNYDEALIYANKICVGDSLSYYCTDQLAWCLTLQKRYRDALNIWKRNDNQELTLNNGHRIGYLYMLLGDEKKANEYFIRQIRYCEESIRLNRSYSQSFRAHYDLAAIYSYLNDKEKAYLYLEEVSENILPPFWMIILMKDDPLFDSIRGEETFRAYLKEMEEKFNAERNRVLLLVPEPERPAS